MDIIGVTNYIIRPYTLSDLIGPAMRLGFGVRSDKVRVRYRPSQGPMRSVQGTMRLDQGSMRSDEVFSDNHYDWWVGN